MSVSSMPNDTAGVRAMMRWFFDEAAVWCRGKNWRIRAPLILYFAYVLIRHVRDPLYSSILGALNLGIHELGHLVFCFLGQTVSIAGGTLLQLFAPVFAILNFYRQRDFFAIALSFGWLSTNFFNVATYAADARTQELPLVSIGGGGVYHDWEYMLSAMNLLPYDYVVAGIMRLLGILSMACCLGAGTWLVLKMADSPKNEDHDLPHSI